MGLQARLGADSQDRRLLGDRPIARLVSRLISVETELPRHSERHDLTCLPRLDGLTDPRFGRNRKALGDVTTKFLGFRLEDVVTQPTLGDE